MMPMCPGFVLKILGICMFFAAVSTSAKGQHTVNFTSDSATRACSPLITTFKSAVTGGSGNFAYFWEFGDGTTSTEVNPGRIYSTGGVYTVRLRVTDLTTGIIVTETKTDFITVLGSPQVDFAADDTAGCFKHQVRFTDFSTAGSGTIVSRLWDFGNGLQSNVNDPSPSTVYNLERVAPGYPVSLTVTNSNGCATTFRRGDYIDVTVGVVADFIVPPSTSCRPPISVTMQNTSSGPGALTFNWDLGNGQTSTDQNPPTTYNSAGTYPVTLIVQSNQGCFDSITRNVIIPNTTVQSTFSTPSDSVCLGSPVQFFNNSVPDPISNLWNFGDGSPLDTRVNPIHTFTSAGTFTVKMVNSFGICADSFTRAIVVLPAAPVNLTSSNNTACRAPHTVNFNANSTGGVSWTWDFGDGTPAVVTTGPNTQHTYQNNGSFTVTVTVTNNQRCPSRVSIPNFVRISPPVITIRNLPDSGCAPFAVTPDVDITTINGVASILWDFGDRTYNQLAPPTHVYNNPGNYRFRIIVTSVGGCVDSLVINNAVTVGNPPGGVPDFVANPLVACAGEPIQFQDLTPNPIFISGREWRFGDGGIIRGQQNPSYRYRDTGTFNVILRVFSNGCGTTVTKNGYIRISGAVPRFNYTVNCTDRRTVSFRDSSINATRITWNFGDGSPSVTNVLNPVHTYPGLGEYKVILTAENGACVFNDTVLIRLINEPANFTIAPNPLCKGVTASLNAIGNIDSNVLRYDWDFGDGNFVQGTKNVLYAFPNSGIYNTRLRVTDINGCTNTANNSLSVGGPRAGLGATNPEGCVGLVVNFIDSSRSDGINPIVQRIWNFGDGTIQTINAPPFTHQYNTAGTFNVTLTIQDAGGCSDSITFNNFVTASDPQALFEVDSAQSCPGAQVDFTNLTDPQINSFKWYFGDGDSSIARDPVKIYTSTGNYTVSLAVRDRFGCADTLTRTNYVTVDLPFADFTLSESIKNCPPLNVDMTFTGRYQQSLRWDFGDGGVSDLLNPKKQYSWPGNYRVSLTVTSPGGCTDTLSKPITIFGPTANFDYSPLAGCDSLTVNFRAFNTNNVDTITWDFGDGRIITTDTTVAYTYRDSGNYRPTIVLQDPSGCRVTVQGPDSIYVVRVFPGFRTDRQVLCDNGPVQFTDTTIVGSRAPKTSWFWDFGDGNTSNLQNPLHQYAAPGLYTVSLTVGTGYGCAETVTIPNYISVVQSPITDIVASTPAVCQLGSITFQGIETVPDTSVLRWSWDFANGQTSNLQNPPAQVYLAPGNFTVRLVSTNSSGCTDTTDQFITIHPNPTVIASPDSTICLGESVPLSVSGALTYTWLPPVNGLSCTDCQTPVATPAITTTYLVQGATQFGCVNTDSVRITVVQPSTVVAPPDDSLCLGENVVLRATGTQVYQWSPPTGLNNVNIPSPIARPTTTTTYVVTGSDFKGCFTTVDSVTVTVFSLPTVSLGPDITVTSGTSDIVLNSVYSNDVIGLLWSPGATLSCTNCPAPLASPKITTTYNLRVTNDGGCIAQDAITVFVVCLNSNVYMPNTFSPNGDGMNDIYYPRGRGINTIRSLKIFNRWGQMVYSRENFQANDPSAGWDGRFRGAALTPDVYVYVVDLVCDNQTIITLKGDVMLVR